MLHVQGVESPDAVDVREPCDPGDLVLESDEKALVSVLERDPDPSRVHSRIRQSHESLYLHCVLVLCYDYWMVEAVNDELLVKVQGVEVVCFGLMPGSQLGP